jgi:hypothetical protein
MTVVIKEAFFIYAEVRLDGLYFLSTFYDILQIKNVAEETHSIFAN